MLLRRRDANNPPEDVPESPQGSSGVHVASHMCAHCIVFGFDCLQVKPSFVFILQARLLHPDTTSYRSSVACIQMMTA